MRRVERGEIAFGSNRTDIRMPAYDITLIHKITDPVDDNIDVRVTFPDGHFYVPTFVTLKNLKTLMDRWRVSGEHAHGIYVWLADMIVVETLTEDVIHDTIADLVRDEQLHMACQRFERNEDD